MYYRFVCFDILNSLVPIKLRSKLDVCRIVFWIGEFKIHIQIQYEILQREIQNNTTIHKIHNKTNTKLNPSQEM